MAPLGRRAPLLALALLACAAPPAGALLGPKGGKGGGRVEWRSEATFSRVFEGGAESFGRFFRTEGAPAVFLEGTSSLASLERLGGDEYRARLEGLRFPGATVTPTVRFRVCESGGDCIRMEAVEATQEVSGSNPVSVRIVESVSGGGLLRLASGNALTFAAAGEGRVELRARAHLELSFDLPRWVLLPTDLLERTGRRVLGAQLERDIPPTLDAFVDAWRADLLAGEGVRANVGA